MARLAQIDILGGGPAGLYLSILLKEAMPDARVGVSEQNPADATFGFGVVFSDQALDFLRADDPRTHDAIAPLMERWRNLTLVHEGEPIVIDGVGFSAIGRLTLLRALQERALALGVEIRFGHAVRAVDELDGDLVVGADGLNSLVRASDEAAFATSLDHFANRFAWFGTPRPFETLTQTFVRTPRGAMNAHHYRYEPGMSTFIVECDEGSFRAHGFEEMDEERTARACEAVFAETLEGAPLVANRSVWRRFPRLWCDRWVAGNRALIGDAAHTAHFSVGSGTRLAMEDAIALARALREEETLRDALEAYDRERRPVARKIVDAANRSAAWYDAFADKLDLSPVDFAYAYLTRSGRIDDDRLRRQSPGFMARLDARATEVAS